MHVYVAESFADFERKNLCSTGKKKMHNFLTDNTTFISVNLLMTLFTKSPYTLNTCGYCLSSTSFLFLLTQHTLLDTMFLCRISMQKNTTCKSASVSYK